jgi:hypothetical protein
VRTAAKVEIGIGPRFFVAAQINQAHKLAWELLSEVADERGGQVTYDPASCPGLVAYGEGGVTFNNA